MLASDNPHVRHAEVQISYGMGQARSIKQPYQH